MFGMLCQVTLDLPCDMLKRTMRLDGAAPRSTDQNLPFRFRPKQPMHHVTWSKLVVAPAKHYAGSASAVS